MVEASTFTEDEYVQVCAMFDRHFYFHCNPDIRAAGLDPVMHFLQYGWKEGRNPNSIFDVRYYLQVNPDILASSINPFYHYLVAGKVEGRRSSPDPVQKTLRLSRPMIDKVSDWRFGRQAPAATDPDCLYTQLATALASSSELVISISHDDYRVNTGGIQNVLQDELKAFEEAGWKYLHLSPVFPLPVIAEPCAADQHIVFGTLSEVELGACRSSDIIKALQALQPKLRINVVVHHLYGHVPEALAELVIALAVDQPVFWVHDFASLCSNYSLLRNDIKFCHAPTADSAACRICSYGDSRVDYLRRMAVFFDKVRPFVLAPSAYALNFWISHTTMSHRGSAVVPPAKLVLCGKREAYSSVERRLRIAYLGYRSYHKGWPVFQALAAEADTTRYQFFQIGGSSDDFDFRISHIDAMASASNQDAMMKAVVSNNIDVVVQWSLCGETFNFTTLEALAAGAFVVARRDAGNVWPAINSMAPHQGMKIEDEAELFQLFEGDELFRRVRTATCRYGAVIRTAGTADWLLSHKIEASQSLVSEAGL